MKRLPTLSSTFSRLCPLFAVAALAGLAGCSAVQFSYNNAGGLIRFMARDYADLDPAQSEALRRGVADLQDWHRNYELPEYVRVLQSAGKRVSRGVTRIDIDWAIDTLRKDYRRFAGRAAEEAAPLLVTLRTEQIDSIEKKLAKDEAKYVKEWLSDNPMRRERHASERMIDRFEEWTGNLSREQQARIKLFVHEHPRNAEIRLEERRRWQKTAVQLLRERRKADELASQLALLFGEPDTQRSDEYVRETRRWESDLANLVVELDKTLTAEQRARVLRRMERYADDFNALTQAPRMAQQSAAPPNAAY